MEKLNYEKYRIKGEETFLCMICGHIAQYQRYGYTWCKSHKVLLREEPEDLEEIVIKKLKEL